MVSCSMLSFVTWSSMDTLTEGGICKLFNVILCNLVIHGYSDRGVYGVFTSFVTWSSMDTLTGCGVYMQAVQCTLTFVTWSSMDTLTGGHGAVQCYPL